MHWMSQRVGRAFSFALLGWVLPFVTAGAYGDDSSQAAALSQDKLWQRTLSLATQGDFSGAADTIRQVHTGGELVERVRSWLESYGAKQAARRELDRADFEKYVNYAKARIERKEYRDALGWALAALDSAEDRGAFLQSDWLQDLVNDSLIAAHELRKEHEWRNAWRIYSYLSSLFEREQRYRKLEREVLTHLRLDTMFGEDSNWKERIEKVRWKYAERALEHIDQYYVEPVAFKELTESALEQLLLLAESKSAQKQFEGLRNEDDRKDFTSRVREHLDQVREASSVDRDECVQRFRRVVKKINKETVRLPEELVVSELLRGALEPLDDFTTIIWPRQSEEFDKHTRGDFVGVGISIIKNRANEIEVVTPLDGTPAYRAGVQAGDIITDVDGTSLKNYSLNKVVRTITGPKGTMVTLTIRRDGVSIRFDLKRAKVKIQSVKGVKRDALDEERWDYWLDRGLGVGYIRITNFQRNTVEDVVNVLSELSAGGLRGLILDLRGNPGGLLDSAWQFASLFLKRDDTVVSTKGRIRSEDHVFHATGAGAGAYSDIPFAVLVDERSASASEIVSGSVRDNHRGVVIGERTFGKFSVQNLIPLGHGGAKLKITTASYYLPNGDSLHRYPESETWGVDPNIPVRLVRKERSKVYQLWREVNLLGPPKPKSEKSATEDDDGAKNEKAKTGDEEKTDVAPDTEQTAEKVADADSKDEADESKEAKLPPLEQPDENDRPNEDPQLDTALLLMRLILLGESYPTLATAELETTMGSAQP